MTNICFKIVFSAKYFLNSSEFDIRHVKCYFLDKNRNIQYFIKESLLAPDLPT